MYRVCLMYNLRIAAISLSTGTVTHPVGFPPEVTKVAFPPWRPPFRLPEPGLAPGAKVKRLVWPDSSWESEILMVWIIQFLGMSLKHPIESHWKSIDHTENHSVVIVVAECIPQKRTLEFLLFSRLSPISDFLESPGNLKPRNWAVVKFHQQVGNLLFGTVRFWARLNWNHQESACMPLVLLLLLGTLVKSKPFPSALRDQWVKESNEQWKTPWWLFRVYSGLYYPVI